MTTMTLTETSAPIDAAPARTAYDALPVELVDVGHAELAYRRTGQGPDLVFVHGWPLDASTFRDLLPILAPDFTCHLFDLPGTGDSKWSSLRDITIAKHADAIATAVDAIGLERYAMLAHDSGAVIARIVAARHQERVTALVAGNTEVPGHKPPLIVLFSRLAHLPGFTFFLSRLVGSRAIRRSRFVFGGAFTDPDRLDGEFGRRFVEPLIRSRRALEGQSGLLRGIDWSEIDRLPEVHARITAPVQLVWGARDPFFPLRFAEAMLEELPAGSELEVIEDAKVFPHEEHPEVFARHARRFLLAHAL